MIFSSFVTLMPDLIQLLLLLVVFIKIYFINSFGFEALIPFGIFYYYGFNV